MSRSIVDDYRERPHMSGIPEPDPDTCVEVDFGDIKMADVLPVEVVTPMEIVLFKELRGNVNCSDEVAAKLAVALGRALDKMKKMQLL